MESEVTGNCHASFGERDEKTRIMKVIKVRLVPTLFSPLLANVALGLIEERYERWVNHQTKRRQSRQCDGIKAAMWSRSVDRQAGRAVYFPFRYADDFVILVSGTQEDALVF